MFYLNGKLKNSLLTGRFEQQVKGDGNGFQAYAGLGYDLRPCCKTILQPSVKTIYSSSDYMEEYFSISPSQSARSGLPAYDADSGFKLLGFQILAIHRVDRRWGIQAMAGYDRLVGDAADSPVVKDKNQYRLSAGLTYAF